MPGLEDEVSILKERLISLEAELSKLRTHETTRQRDQREQAFLSLISEAQTVDSSLASKPNLTLALRPQKEEELRGLFGNASSELVRLLEDGAELRQGGFSLDKSYLGSKIVRGTYRAVIRSGHDIRLLSRDGMVIAIAAADQSFLAWAMKESHASITLNPIAIVEYVYSFVTFAQKMADLAGLRGAEWEFVTEWKNISEHRPLFLPTSRVNTIGFYLGGGQTVAPDDSRVTQTITISGSPDFVAYRILAAIYNRAGANDGQIPYVATGTESVDLDGLLSLR